MGNDIKWYIDGRGEPFLPVPLSIIVASQLTTDSQTTFMPSRSASNAPKKPSTSPIGG
jgi:hypothetical protein